METAVNNNSKTNEYTPSSYCLRKTVRMDEAIFHLKFLLLLKSLSVADLSIPFFFVVVVFQENYGDSKRRKMASRLHHMEQL